MICSFFTKRPYILLTALLIFVSSISLAQVKPDFSIAQDGHCSPVVATFTNNTSGASPSATYAWNLDNGSKPTSKDASGIYKEEKTYTITLTVTDGGKTYPPVSQQLIVSKKPTVDFTATDKVGCIPFDAKLSSNSTAGDGTIATYYWDFGDGNVQSTTNKDITHTYTSTTNSKPTIRLTVTNSFGCYATKEASILTVKAAINASFTPSKTALCEVTDAVTFTNNSTGPGTLKYSWDFGDKKTSTDPNASHVYGSKAIYPVVLTVTNEDGCKSVSSAQSINVANFTVDFTVPSPLCQNTTVYFTDKSTPVSTSSLWQVEGGSYYYSGASTFGHYFSIAGAEVPVTLTNTYGDCKVAVTKKVKVSPQPTGGFTIDMGKACGAPVVIKFKDTSSTASSRVWDFGDGTTSSDKEPSHTYQFDGYRYISLAIKNDGGCTNTIGQSINIYKPNVVINPDIKQGCVGLKVTFNSSAYDDIVSYNWDFGDGTKSTDKLPKYTYNKEGSYTVTLSFKTKGGCEGTSYTTIDVFKKPKADFTSDKEVCGNNFAVFTSTTVGNTTNYSWDFGDNTMGFGGSPTSHQYFDAKTYTVTMIAFNGNCSDTITKTDQIKVLPPFPKINSYSNTCSDTRGLVVFYQSSRQATGWSWDFGDGTPPLVLTNDQYQVQHLYTKTGKFKTVLTATNGACSVRDSVNTAVLLKQNPVLSADRAEICASGSLKVTINNLEANPRPDYFNNNYSINIWQYDDRTPAYGIGYVTPPGTWGTSYSGELKNFDVGKDGLRVLLYSTSFYCADTSNYIPLKIKGPFVDFNLLNYQECYKNPFSFQDASRPQDNVAIKKWEWDFGDGQTSTQLTDAVVKHVYPSPGYYYVSLKVTDADGCFSSTSPYAKSVTAAGPKADFTYWPTNVQPNNWVTYNNGTTNTYPYYDVSYKWKFTFDKSEDPDYTYNYSKDKIYDKIGTDTVTLYAVSRTSGCADTITKVISIKYVTAAFDTVSSYVNGNGCPPMIVKCTSNSLFSNSVSWDFGDGSRADNQNQVTHTYLNAGPYTITLYAYGSNGAIDSTIKNILVKGPYAVLTADTYSGCMSQHVKLSADVKNATSFYWDFGDGNTLETTETFTEHDYTTVGSYTPLLVLKDGNNCKSISNADQQIVIDSLNINFTSSPSPVCDSAIVSFSPIIKSFAADQLQQPLVYSWSFGTGNAEDVADTSNPQLDYNKLGDYEVLLHVVSPYGCEKDVKDSVHVVYKTKASITGAGELCQDSKVAFKGTADRTGGIQWKWMFDNNNTSALQNPADETYGVPGTYNIALIVNRNGCSDTSYHPLIVHAKPIVDLQPKDSAICLGSSIKLVAHDGTTYEWSPDIAAGNATTADPAISPAYSTLYKVKVTNAFTCVNYDSTFVTVARPFKMELPLDTFVCKGDTVQLPVSGAYTYAWAGANISDAKGSSPYTWPSATTTYHVIGEDKYHCFTDEGDINVDVKPLPAVDAGPDLQVLTGDQVALHATGSSDVIKWTWSPSTYLNCTNCASPLSTPRDHMTYIATGETKFGCSTSDTMRIKLVCAERVSIPNAFTPNGDGNNDMFNVHGRGIKMIRHLRIFSRYGDVIFDRSNYEIGDRGAAWDGTINSHLVETGTYVYFIEILCDSGDTFVRKGTIVVIR